MPHAGEEALEVQKASQAALRFFKKSLCIENQGLDIQYTHLHCILLFRFHSYNLRALLSPNTEEAQEVAEKHSSSVPEIGCQENFLHLSHLGSSLCHQALACPRQPGCDAENFLMYLSSEHWATCTCHRIHQTHSQHQLRTDLRGLRREKQYKYVFFATGWISWWFYPSVAILEGWILSLCPKPVLADHASNNSHGCLPPGEKAWLFPWHWIFHAALQLSESVSWSLLFRLPIVQTAFFLSL